MPEPRRAAAGRPVRRSARKTEEEGPGLFGRLAGLIAARPAEAGGTLIAVVMLGAIIGNAAFLQTKRHPDPFFATRGPAGAAAPAGPAPAAPAAQAGATPPLPQAPPSEADKARIAAIQRGLAALSLYGGPIDGLTGGRTRAAIVAYQRREGLAPDGEPTEALLARLKAATPAPTPATPPRSAAEPPPAGTDSAATGSVPAPHPAPPRDRGRVVALQAALNGLGYGPLDLDGRMGEATAEAIRRFELDNGMPISGLVDDDLIATMIRIGAMKPH